MLSEGHRGTPVTIDRPPLNGQPGGFMGGSPDGVIDLIFGRWRSQTLYAGAELGIFDHLQKDRPADAKQLAIELHATLPSSIVY